jgi:hypothetical protein
VNPAESVQYVLRNVPMGTRHPVYKLFNRKGCDRKVP